MPNNLNKNTLIQRVQASGWPLSMTCADIEAIDSLAGPADFSLLKPLSRKNNQRIKHSFYNIDNVPSFKLARIGNGSYGKVYVHVDALPDETLPHLYVVKVVHLDYKNELKNQELRRGIEHEITVLKGLNQYLRHGERVTSSGKTKLYVVMCYIPGKTLYDYIKALEYKFSAAKALQIMQLVAEQLKQLHALGYAHGDLHTDNIMIYDSPSNQISVRLIDFNLSRPKEVTCWFDPPLKKNQFPHIPDECCDQSQVSFTYASDVFALGDVFKEFFERTTQPSPEIEILIKKMRSPAESRCTLTEVITKLKELQKPLKPAPSVRKAFQPLRLASPPVMIASNIKEKVLTALGQYLIGQHTWRPYFLDATYVRKSEFMRNTIKKMILVNNKSAFEEQLVQSLKEYTEQFVIPELSHYAAQHNLGRGVECFVNAIKVCGEDGIIETAVNELTKTLPSANHMTASFLKKFREMLTVSSLKALIKST